MPENRDFSHLPLGKILIQESHDKKAGHSSHKATVSGYLCVDNNTLL